MKAEHAGFYDALRRSRSVSMIRDVANFPAFLLGTPTLDLCIKKEIQRADKVLDIGCGRKSRLPDGCTAIGLDVFLPYLQSKKREKPGSNLVLADAIRMPFRSGTVFDVILLIDVIEHLEKPEAREMIQHCKSISRKIVVFTPNGELEQRAYDGNPAQAHRSAWEFDDLRSMGFEVSGMLGPKVLRGERNAPRLRPRWLWWLALEPLNAFSAVFPRRSTALLGVWRCPIDTGH